MSMIRFSVFALTATLVATASWGQNLVSNPNFDTDVAGWLPFAETSIVWDPLDAEGNPASGSAVVTNLRTTAGESTGARQCIEGITGEMAYYFAADVLLPSGQSETGYVNLLLQWYDQPGCSTGYLSFVLGPIITTSTPDVWYSASDTAEAPPGAQSARLHITVSKNEASGSLDAHFDNVEFAKEQLFGDGFESSDTSAWSSVVGGT